MLLYLILFISILQSFINIFNVFKSYALLFFNFYPIFHGIWFKKLQQTFKFNLGLINLYYDFSWQCSLDVSKNVNQC